MKPETIDLLIVLTNIALVSVTIVAVLVAAADARRHRNEARVAADRHEEEMLHDQGLRDSAEMKRLAHLVELVLADERETLKAEEKPSLRSA
jgi:hypothetical protein